jgi:CAAX protease family protein
VALLCGLATTIVVSIVVGLVAGAAGADVEHSPAGLDIGLTVFQNMALFGAAYLFARVISRPRAEDFGLGRPSRFWLAVGVLLAVWVTFFTFAAVWAAVLGLHEDSDLPDRLGAGDSTVNLVAVTILVTVVAPVGEELFFRGYFFGALRNWRGLWPAASITGLVFGAIHLGSAPVGQLVPLAVFGMGLCLLYHWSGSLYPCIALHAFNNALAFGVGEGWPAGIIVAAMPVAAIVAVAIAALIGRALGRRRPAAPRPAVAPAG